MGQLEDLRAFLQIVEQQSISRAAAQSGVAKSAMSRRLSQLEQRMQTTLINRTTRQWSLTEAGRQYYERGQAMAQSFEEFEAGVRDDAQELKGEIRLSVPLYFGKFSLTKPLLTFARQHPRVRLNTQFSDRVVDIISEQFDLVVRIAELADSTLIARQLCQTTHLCCASPEYLAAAAALTKPADLQHHRIIQYGSTIRPQWSFVSNGRPVSIQLKASMNSHDGGFLIDAASDGLGVIRVPDFMAQPALDSGRLIQVLQPFSVSPRGIHVVYPEARYLNRRTRALVEFLVSEMASGGQPKLA